MIRSELRIIGALTAALVLSGCVTSTLRVSRAEPGRVSGQGSPVEYSVTGMNSGVYLFYYIPLWSGNPRRPNHRDYDLFEHRVNDKSVYRMFDACCKRLKAGGVEDIRMNYRSTGIWTLGVFWKRSVNATGVLVSGPVRKTE